jgi:hypothetical protein
LWASGENDATLRVGELHRQRAQGFVTKMRHPRVFDLRGWNKAVALWFPAHDNSLAALLTVVGWRAIGASGAGLIRTFLATVHRTADNKRNE